MDDAEHLQDAGCGFGAESTRPGPSLRREAEGLIRELRLIEILQPYGRAGIVGSVALDLVVKLDIDAHLLVSTPDLLSVVDRIYHQLLDQAKVREVRITDYRDEGGVKIGIDEYAGPSGAWSVDIWITDRLESTAFATVDRLRQEMTAEHREAILKLKREYYRRGLLRDGLSLRIYEAVVDHGVRTVEEFEEHSEGQGSSRVANTPPNCVRLSAKDDFVRKEANQEGESP